jgi:hypothetical protein
VQVEVAEAELEAEEVRQPVVRQAVVRPVVARQVVVRQAVAEQEAAARDLLPAELPRAEVLVAGREETLAQASTTREDSEQEGRALLKINPDLAITEAWIPSFHSRRIV